MSGANMAVDIDGALLPGYGAAGHVAAPLRPDHYVFGLAASVDQVPVLIADLRDQLTVSPQP